MCSYFWKLKQQNVASPRLPVQQTAPSVLDTDQLRAFNTRSSLHTGVNGCSPRPFLPADGYVPVLRVLRGCPWFKVGHVKVGQRVVDEAVHGPRLAEHVLVHQSRDEIGREGNHKGLKRETDRQGERVRISDIRVPCWPESIPLYSSEVNYGKDIERCERCRE